MEIITTHLNADFDAVASAIVIKKLYPEANIVLPGAMEKKVKEFIELFFPEEIKKLKDISPEHVKKLIIVDTKHPDRIGPLKALIGQPNIKIHIYDHHPPTKEDIKGELQIIENVGAVSTIVTSIIQRKKLMLTPMEATLLCLGIYQETGSLLFPSTTPKDLIAVAYLLKRGANLNIVSEFLKVEMSKEEITLLNELVGSLKEIILQDKKIKIAKGKMEGFGDVAHLAHTIMDMEDIDALFMLIGMADKILVVARSKTPEVDVAQILSEMGGGGHPSAASATIKDIPFELVEEKLEASLKKHIKPVKLASDVMTSPVIVLDWMRTIKDAEDMMTKYGVNVLPIVKNNKYLGIITREVVEKALFHGFHKSKCIDFATTDAMTVVTSTPIKEVEAIMIEQNQRFIPVLDGERIEGAITRTDIMRALYEDVLRKSRVITQESTTHKDFNRFERNVSAMLKDHLTEPLYNILLKAGETADEIGMNAYLVGGCVRDLIRREENFDIDIVVEGSGIEFAKKLANQIKAKILTHNRFGTASIIVNNAGKKGEPLRIDIATARTEYYESPATLPKVEVSSIKKDLYRRDFTINTMAVKLNKKHFGLLIDFFGGQRDIKDKQIRVLHNLSFVEDPTRAFRAIRFSERFGYKLTKHTENLIKLAIKMNIFEKLSGSRIYDELMLIFKETNPLKALKRLNDYNLLSVIHKKLSYTPTIENLLISVHETIIWFELLFLKEKYDKGLIYLIALLNNLKHEEIKEALQRLMVSKQVETKIFEDRYSSQEIIRNLEPNNPVDNYHLLKGKSIEAILFSMASCKDSGKKKAISQYLLELRHIKPLIKGKDLIELGLKPGPQFSDILNKILDEKLKKKLITKDEELNYVKNLLLQSTFNLN
ncbi:MAG: CBS domain-containing protein [Thermodesulfovibrionales bacterium]|nr:CBS domain-containing protein [Thermodesulfovibrionales bacterium]